MLYIHAGNTVEMSAVRRFRQGRFTVDIFRIHGQGAAADKRTADVAEATLRAEQEVIAADGSQIEDIPGIHPQRLLAEHAAAVHELIVNGKLRVFTGQQRAVGA